MRARLTVPGRVRHIAGIADYHTVIGANGHPVLRSRFIVNRNGAIYEYDVPASQIYIVGR